MRLLLTIFVVSMLYASVLAAAGADNVIDLSTLNKKPVVNTVTIPQLTPNMPTAFLGATTTSTNVLDLSTLGKSTTPSVPAVAIKGAAPITITPMFSIMNNNVTSTSSGMPSGTVFTLPIAISSYNATVYTAPIAIFGGS